MSGKTDYTWWAIWNTTNKSVLQNQAIQNFLLHWNMMFAHPVVIHFVTYVNTAVISVNRSDIKTPYDDRYALLIVIATVNGHFMIQLSSTPILFLIST
jgi:hypothetical protein